MGGGWVCWVSRWVVGEEEQWGVTYRCEGAVELRADNHAADGDDDSAHNVDGEEERSKHALLVEERIAQTGDECAGHGRNDGDEGRGNKRPHDGFLNRVWGAKVDVLVVERSNVLRGGGGGLQQGALLVRGGERAVWGVHEVLEQGGPLRAVSRRRVGTGRRKRTRRRRSGQLTETMLTTVRKSEA